jgi:iron complex transport system permease protein
MPLVKKISAGRVVFVVSCLGGLAVASVLLSLMVGGVILSPGFVLRALYDAVTGAATQTGSIEGSILLDIRLPRAIMALLVGGGLAAAGVVYQVLLRNVLADPYILGISGGASVGALIAIVTGLTAISLYALPASAFAGAMIVVALVVALNTNTRLSDPNTLLLSGVMAGAFFSAAILVLITTIGAPLREAMYWLVGSVSNASNRSVSIVAAVVVPVMAALIPMSRGFNLLAHGEETAHSLGLRHRRMALTSYLLASLLTAAVVSFTGLIGFVGFAVPHIARLTLGSDHRILVPASFLAGGTFLVLSDLLARVVIYPAELPVGAVTAAIGAPVFILLLARKS